ncbi:MAG: hypothetical protein K6G13_03440 [Agathobacter sp.]|uniref:hypothetical protein n=1 Tax=Agathobacter sp. TaxID=2021311 RepID=UPI0025912331|nr:hypothetical protein [Agathobacter sp.]MCR5677066.1 hypothetical protein [Agathobacter sp.]
MLKYLYTKWILNTKNLVIVVLLVFAKKIIVDKVYNVYAMTAEPFCIFEPLIMIMNSGLIVLLLSLFFIFMMSEYPVSDSSLYYQLIRSGRKKWFYAQIYFAIVAIITYLVIVFGYTILATQSICFLADGWSLNISDYSYEMGLISYVPIELFNQMPPVKAFIWSLVLFLTYLYFLLGMQMIGFAYGKKSVVDCIQMILLFAGIASLFIRNELTWLFPVSHSILFIHFTKYYKAALFSPYLSFVLLFGFGTLLYVMSYIRMKKTNVDDLKGN